MIYTNPYPDFTARESQDPVTGLIPPIPLVIDGRDKGPVLLERYGENCRDGTEAERALCVMRDLAARNSMRFYVARTSSGVRVVMPSIDIVTRLNELTPTIIETFIRNAERSANTEPRPE